MAPPTSDGNVTTYAGEQIEAKTPRILYVNGIQTTGEVHEKTALVLSQVTMRPVIGVYNQTAGTNSAKGMVFDLLQCGADWIDGFTYQLGEFGFDGVNAAINKVRSWTGSKDQTPADAAKALRSKLSHAKLVQFMNGYLAATNKASAAMFRELNSSIASRQLIVAHSQGNLVTASALWALQIVHGERGLQNLQVYSIASPVPAWPAGINFRIKVYGHKNDPVTLADPKNWLNRRSKGDWRMHGDQLFEGIAPHDIAVNFFGTNFVSRIRSDLGLGPMVDTTGLKQPYSPGHNVHVVNRGDSLSSISKQYYGTTMRWKEIYTQNRSVVGTDPNRIRPGMKLVIPK